MRKLLGLVVVAFMFVACGSDAPDTVVKKYCSAFAEGNGKEAAKYVYFESENERNLFIKWLDEFAGEIKSSNAKKGGIKSIETIVLNKSENKARVSCIIKFKDGKTTDDVINLTKINGTWYMDSAVR